MFHLVTGPFQPVLEPSLVEEIRKQKSVNSYSPLAIVVPSEVLRRRLQWLLCVEQGLALYDVHFLTFHQFALRLYDELRPQIPSIERPTFRLISEFTFRQYLEFILRSQQANRLSVSELNPSPGLCAALWSTIRDLKDAMIPPSVIRQAVDEGLFESGGDDGLRTLCVLYEAMTVMTQRLHVGGPDDLTSLVIPHVPHSAFLARLTHVSYYGFYDLTQVQLSLFETVTQFADVSVYFPCIDHPAFTFARRFHDRHLLAGAVRSETSELSKLSNFAQSQRPVEHRLIKVMNAVGADDELTLACKEILNLRELHGYRFEDIGLVVRTLAPYQPMLDRLFAQHRIPFTSSAVRPIIHEPGIKLLLQLADLPVKRFPASDMIDVLRSPYYQVGCGKQAQALWHSDRWEEILHTLGIVRGKEQWARFSTILETTTCHVDDSGIAKDSTLSPHIFLATARELDRLAHELINDCEMLPSRGHVAELTEAYRQLIETHLSLPIRGDAESPGGAPVSDTSLSECVQHIFKQLKQLDEVQETITREEWTQILHRVIQEYSRPLSPGPFRGVRVLDAMAARGLPFRAVIILGLNEKVFPRYIREDAFLRDGHRRVLAETLGYKIDEKHAGYDEERLLFALVHQAAQDRLYLSYQRADEEGRPLAPSSFLRELAQNESPVPPVPEWSLARRFSERLDDHLFRDSILTREELGLKLLRHRRDPSALLEHADRNSLIFQQGLLAIAATERPMTMPGVHDGMVGPIDAHWQHVTNRGVSPSSLEHYAQCPFRYYASHLIRMNDRPDYKTEELPVSVMGLLYHAVLQKVYAHFIQNGWPDQLSSSHSTHPLIAVIIDEVFTSHAAIGYTGYWLMWQLLKDVINEVVVAEIDASQQEYMISGFRPFAVEVETTGHVDLSDLKLNVLKIHGRLDRVDRHKTDETFRIVDYKLKVSSQRQTREQDLLASGIRGYALQPSLYSLMSVMHIHDDAAESRQPFCPESVEFVYLAPNREPSVDRAVFDRASWNSHAGQQLHKTLLTLVHGIREGEYFILPGEYCKHCPVSTACRRLHETTWLRSYRSNQAKQIRHMRKQEILRD
ncbi:MAG: ATP-dependent helicase/deoxyribonuclease subunit B [Nitrospirales bacterium]|nr:MAG: ATP-dependent helicase/deoxyribonuclease subunit B [Nitrospirales bacterium]